MTTVKSGARFAYVKTVRRVSDRKLTLVRATEQADKQLQTVLALKEPPYAEIDVLITKYDRHDGYALLLR